MYGLQRTDVAGIKKPAVLANSGPFDVNFSKSLSLFNIVSVPKSSGADSGEPGSTDMELLMAVLMLSAYATAPKLCAAVVNTMQRARASVAARFARLCLFRGITLSPSFTLLNALFAHILRTFRGKTSHRHKRNCGCNPQKRNIRIQLHIAQAMPIISLNITKEKHEQLSVLFFITLVSTTNSHLGTRKVKLFQATFYSTKLPPSPISSSPVPPPGITSLMLPPAAPPSGGVTGG